MESLLNNTNSINISFAATNDSDKNRILYHTHQTLTSAQRLLGKELCYIAIVKYIKDYLNITSNNNNSVAINKSGTNNEELLTLLYEVFNNSDDIQLRHMLCNILYKTHFDIMICIKSVDIERFLLEIDRTNEYAFARRLVVFWV
jgi:hypothetical protein